MRNTMKKKNVWTTRLLVFVMTMVISLSWGTMTAKAADWDRVSTYFIGNDTWVDDENPLTGYRMDAGTNWKLELDSPYSEDYNVVLYITMKPGAGSLADNGYLPEVVVGDKTYTYTEIMAMPSLKVLVKANSSASVIFQYPANTPASAKGYNYVIVSASAEPVFSGPVLGDRDHPTAMKFDTEYALGSGKYATYTGGFTLNKPAKVTFETNGDFKWGLSKYSGDHEIHVGETGESLKLPVGTYYVSANGGVGRRIKIKKVDFDWGTMTFTQTGSTIKFTYKPASTTSAEDAANTNIDYYYIDNQNSEIIEGKKKECTAKVESTSYVPGWKECSVTVEHPDYGSKVFKGDYKILPQSPKMGFVVQNKSLKLVNYGRGEACRQLLTSDYGDSLRVQVLKGSKWETLKTIKTDCASDTISNLKPNTAYKYRFIGVVSPKNGKPALESTPSQVYTIKTGQKSKPAIASVKISGAKTTFHKKVPAGGYWDSFGQWHRTAEIPAHYTTTYKITVKLKKKVKGPQGLVINGEYVKGNGKKFTLKETCRGKRVGKSTKVKVQYYNDRNYGGFSPSASKKAKIKK